MKLNNKGFAVTTIMYMILVMGMILIILILSMLSSRRLILEKSKQEALTHIKELPLIYQEVEYIESSGTQYILTDIIPNDVTGTQLTLSVSNTSGDTLFFGSRTSSSGRYWNGQNSAKLYFGWNGATAIVNRIAITQKEKFTISSNYYNNKKNIYNGTDHSDITATLVANSHPIAIFAGNDTGTIKYYSSIKLYNFKITNGNTLIANFIPCYKTSDKEIGLYDLINNKFYTNQGTGTFNKGKNIY